MNQFSVKILPMMFIKIILKSVQISELKISMDNDQDFLNILQSKSKIIINIKISYMIMVIKWIAVQLISPSIGAIKPRKYRQYNSDFIKFTINAAPMYLYLNFNFCCFFLCDSLKRPVKFCSETYFPSLSFFNNTAKVPPRGRIPRFSKC